MRSSKGRMEMESEGRKEGNEESKRKKVMEGGKGGRQPVEARSKREGRREAGGGREGEREGRREKGREGGTWKCHQIT